MILLLMRHGIAEDLEDTEHGEDFERRLTRKGRRRVKEMARLLQRLGLKPTHYVSSPRLRALETAQIVADEFRTRREVHRLSSLDFEGRWEVFVANIRELTRDARSAVVLAAGHEPCCGEFAAQALLPVQHSIPVRKTSVIVLEWDGPIAPREADLAGHLTSRLARLAL